MGGNLGWTNLNLECHDVLLAAALKFFWMVLGS
jgi:hypothetical protein